jgi:hypothetical protein
MAESIKIFRENQKIKIISEEIDYKSVAKHVEKIAFQHCTRVFPDFGNLRGYPATSSEEQFACSTSDPLAPLKIDGSIRGS